MKKALPKVYANKNVNKNINNEKSFHLTNDEKKEEVKIIKEVNIEDTKAKIKEIFNSANYVYKIDVEIETKDGILHKRIIGKNKNNLITIENELIPIKQIIDIRKK